MHKSSRAKSDGAGVYVKFIPTLRVIVTAKKHYDSNVGEKEDGKEENERERKREEERERDGVGEEGGKRKSLFERKCEYNKRIDWFCRGYAPIGLHSARKKAANNFSIVD